MYGGCSYDGRAEQEDSRVSRWKVGWAGARGDAKGFAKRGFQALTHACVQEGKATRQKDRRGGGQRQRRDSAGGMWRC